MYDGLLMEPLFLMDFEGAGIVAGETSRPTPSEIYRRLNMAIRIITDTSSDFDYAALNDRAVDMVSLTINVGEKSYADGIDLTHTDFYDMLLSDTIAPKTSQPTPQDFLNLFEKAKANGDDVIVLPLSSQLSGTMQSAVNAKNLCGYDRIYIIDTLTASAGLQMLADLAEKMAAEGKPVEEIVDRLNDVKDRIRIYLGLDTLKYLYRGGRLSRVEAGIGTLASIRPLLALKNGKLEVIAKCMGTKKAIRKLAEIVADSTLDAQFPMQFLYSYNDANCRALMAALDAEDHHVVELGPTLATHTGPGVYAAVIVEAE